MVRTVNERNHLGSVDQLTELEFINGKVYASLWHKDEIVVIDHAFDLVEATLNLAALERPRPSDPEAVLNGIAWDPAGSLLHVTGKRGTQVHVLRIRE